MDSPGRIGFFVENYSGYSRGILSGALKYSQTKKKRRNFLLPLNITSYYQESIETFRKYDGEALFVCTSNQNFLEEIINSDMPAVIVTDRLEIDPLTIPRKDLIFLVIDFKQTTALVLDYFLENGFNNFGFLGNLTYYKARRLYQEFTEQSSQLNRKIHLYNADTFSNQSPLGIPDMINVLTDWIKTLPRPINIFTMNDYWGQHLLGAVYRMGLDLVPRDIAVLGTGNDSILCEMNVPALSSVEFNFFLAGYEAAVSLNQMLNGEKFSPVIKARPLWIVPRKSTETIVDDQIVAQALKYIRGRCRVNVKDIVRYLGISRRSLEQRFLRNVGHTLGDEIQSKRLIRIKQLLFQTDMSIQEIASQIGFSRSSYLTTIFKKEFGITPLEYREQNRIPESR